MAYLGRKPAVRKWLMDAPSPGGLGGTYAGNPLAVVFRFSGADMENSGTRITRTISSSQMVTELAGRQIGGQSKVHRIVQVSIVVIVAAGDAGQGLQVTLRETNVGAFLATIAHSQVGFFFKLFVIGHGDGVGHLVFSL